MSELERCQSGFQVLSQLLSYGLDRLWLCSRWLNWIADPAVLTISWALPKDVTKKWGGKRFSLTENKVNIIMVGTYSNGFNSKHLETFVGRSCHSWPYPWLLWPPTNVCGHEHCNPHCYQWIFLALSYSGPLQSFGEPFPYSQMSSASSSWANLNSSWLIGAARICILIKLKMVRPAWLPVVHISPILLTPPLLIPTNSWSSWRTFTLTLMHNMWYLVSF